MRRWPLTPLPRIPLGTYGWGPFSRALALPREELEVHAHVVGVSGSGKSFYIVGYIINLLKAGYAVTLLDPAGNTARLLLANLILAGFFDRPDVAADPTQHLLYLDLPAAERAGTLALPFNLLATTRLPAHTVAAQIKEAFLRAFPELAFGAPMFAVLVLNGVKLLVSNRLPLTRLYRLLTDAGFRHGLLAQEADPDVIGFFRQQYDRLRPGDQAIAAGAALRRSNLLTFDPFLKASLSQPDCLLDFRGQMDRGTSLVVNLALQNRDALHLFGCLLTVMAEHAALSRSDQPPERRKRAHFLVIDEYAVFAATSAAAIGAMLSRTRQERVFVVPMHQNWDQAGKLNAALQNVGLSIAFRLGHLDAGVSAPIFGSFDPLAVKKTEPVYFAEHGKPTVIDERTRELSLQEQRDGWEQALMHLDNRQFYARLPDHTRRPVTLRSLPLRQPTDAGEALARWEAFYLKSCFRSIGPHPVPSAAPPPRLRAAPVFQRQTLGEVT